MENPKVRMLSKDSFKQNLVLLKIHSKLLPKEKLDP